MDFKRSPFPAGWWSIDLPGYRDHPDPDQTYSLFPYESLPPLPLDVFHGDFRWLAGQGPGDDPAPEGPEAQPPDTRPAVVVESLADAKLPGEFLRFMGSHALQNRIRTCTDCFFQFPEWVIPSPHGDGGYLIQFLQDSQDCLFWYLYLKKNKRSWASCVVASGESLNPYSLGDEGEPNEFVYCAPGFEPFLYRFWIENEIWFALEEGGPLTEEQRSYVGHYRPISGKDRPR